MIGSFTMMNQRHASAFSSTFLAVFQLPRDTESIFTAEEFAGAIPSEQETTRKTGRFSSFRRHTTMRAQMLLQSVVGATVVELLPSCHPLYLDSPASFVEDVL